MRRLACSVLALTALGACSSAASTGRPAAITVDVSVSACGKGWAGGTAGQQHFVLHDVDSRSGDVALIDAANGAVYAEVEPIAPGTSTDLHAELGAGRYAFRCAMEDEPAVTGPVIRLTGSARGDTPAVQPVAQADLLDATRSYEQYVIAQLPTLHAAAGRLQSDIDRGDLAAARRDWLPAQLDYLHLGAAYSAFGDLDAAIDARADALPKGVHDPSWRGLLRLQYGLWHGEPGASLRPIAADLVTDVASVQHDFPHAQLDPAELSIRAHEITEDALEFVLTGRDDYGAHAAVAELAADLAATRTVLGMVRTLLAPRYGGLHHVDDWLSRTARDVDAARGPLTAFPQSTRERLDADIGELAELLAPVASILEPRRTS